jgi:exodeoxyribonuclease V gamma subunit
MALHVHRSQRVEVLVSELAELAPRLWGEDPFAPIPVVVGSRGMDRWLRHELATRSGSAANLQCLFPRTAFDAVAAWLSHASNASGEDPSAPDWEVAEKIEEDPWSGAALVARVVTALRASLGDAAFEVVRGYLGEGVGPVSARELAFAEQVAQVLERLLYDRPEDARAWVADPTSAPAEHVWLASLLASVSAEIARPSPADHLHTLLSSSARASSEALVVFGLSTLRPGDKLRIAGVARHLDVHLFTLAPSSVWWEDIRSKSEVRAAVARERDEKKIAEHLREFDRRNVLLASNGMPSRDLQMWLESIAYLGDLEDSGDGDAPATLLTAVQRWVNDAGDNPDTGAWSHLVDGASIEISASHGPLRECESLRDALLRRFSADPTLEPRHVLIMTPDLATYAPILSAVFARKSGAVPPIPVEIADLGVTATNGLAAALLQLLELADERVTASRLLNLLANPLVRARAKLAEDDLPDLRTMLIESGVCWAWNAADRENHQQPSLDQNTVRFGLERLALGALMHDPGALWQISASVDATLGPAVPYELASRDRVERFGRFAEFCASVGPIAGEAEPASASAWRQRLAGWLDRFTTTSDTTAWLRVQVETVLAAALPDADDAEVALEFDRSAILHLLRTAFELPRAGDRPPTSAATVCALEPMRSVPFRVIAIVGLNDGQFPRAGRPASWDPFAARRRGEDDRRTIDRHMFLEAVLCARDALLLSGVGVEPKRAQRMPLSVVVSELAELVSAATGVAADPDEAGPAVIRRHRLQPWSEGAFLDEATRPFDDVWRAGAEALRGERRQAGIRATLPTAPWPPEEHPLRQITAADLARALSEPQRQLLQKRLGIELEADDDDVRDREPLDTIALEPWIVLQRALDALGTAPLAPIDTPAADAQREALENKFGLRLRGEGALPLSGRGAFKVRQVVGQAIQARRVAERVPGSPLEGASPTWKCELRFDELDGARDVRVTLTATAPEVRRGADGDHLVWTVAAKQPRYRHLLVAWVSLLVALAAPDPQGRPVIGAHVAAHGAESPSSLVGISPEVAKAVLFELVQVFRWVRRAPVYLFPTVSPSLVASLIGFERKAGAYASAVAAAQNAGSEVPPWPPDLPPPGAPRWTQAVLDAREAWDGRVAPDRKNPWVRALFGENDIEDLAAGAVVRHPSEGGETVASAGEIIVLAERVWRRLLESQTILVESEEPGEDE